MTSKTKTAGKTAGKTSKTAGTISAADRKLLADLAGKGKLAADSGGGPIPVKFRGKTYASMSAVPTAVLAAATAADLKSCGNSQAVAVRKRVLRDRAREAGVLN